MDWKGRVGAEWSGLEGSGVARKGVEWKGREGSGNLGAIKNPA